MVLCEIDALGNPMVTYLALSCLTLTSQMILSGGAFLYYYGERETYMHPPIKRLKVNIVFPFLMGYQCGPRNPTALDANRLLSC
jgi:hypothetical protein